MNKINNKLLKDFIYNPIDKLIKYNVNNNVYYFMFENKEYSFFILHSYDREVVRNENHAIINSGYSDPVVNKNAVYPVNLYLLMKLFYETKTKQ